MNRFANFIDGTWKPPASYSYYARVNPARPSEKLGEFPLSTGADAADGVAAARSASEGWAAVPGPERAGLIIRFADLMEKARDELAKIVTLEQGKTLREASGEVSRAVAEARFMAGEASRMHGSTFPSERARISAQTILEPLGVVAAISPWNFPVVTPVRKLAPALAYGNTVVFKPASYTPWTAVRLVELFEQAGFPRGVVNLVLGEGETVGRALASDPRVDGVTFTGSTQIGLAIYGEAARRNAKVQLEMGGKNAAVVWNYADLDRAAAEIVSAAFLCSGQRCTALSRVIVSDDQADALVDRLAARIEAITVGDGMEDGTTMGPLVSERQLRTVEEYVRRGIDEGARLVAGGTVKVERPEEEGYYFAPTLFDHVEKQSPLARDEIFGPVLPVLRVPSFEDAIRTVNDSPYGLAASLFCEEMSRIREFAERVRTGMIHVNHGTASQAHVPFGGMKQSGQGAYSIGPTAREFYTHVKAVYIAWD
jgi:aldehyde dehydrogenase (NAD+)